MGFSARRKARIDLSGLALMVMTGVVCFLVLRKPPSGTEEASSALTRPALFDNAAPGWQAEAAANLTAWRSTLFLRNADTTRRLEEDTQKDGVQPSGHSRFDLLNPFITCPHGEALRRVGDSGDGGKLVCPSALSEGCVVYSLGSNKQVDFELGILRSTPCSIVTMDCTVPGESLDPRHTYIQKCLGTAERMQADPERWTTLEAVMAEQGHEQLDLLKIDIEGSEYDVFAHWSLNDAKLPKQISMELHWAALYFGTPAWGKHHTDGSLLMWPPHLVSLAEMSLFMGHLANLGYGIVSKELNPLCAHCSEFTLLRVAEPLAAQ